MSYRRTHYELEVRLFHQGSEIYDPTRVGRFDHLTEAAQEVIKLADALEHGESRDSETFDQLLDKLGFTDVLQYRVEILVVGVTVQWFDGQAVKVNRKGES